MGIAKIRNTSEAVLNLPAQEYCLLSASYIATACTYCHDQNDSHGKYWGLSIPLKCFLLW